MGYLLFRRREARDPAAEEKIAHAQGQDLSQNPSISR
jgi:hypothetical protein